MINQISTKSKDLTIVKFTKYLSYLIGIYTTFFIIPTVLLKRTIAFPFFGVIPISIFFTGTYFVVLDVITEVYGYQEAKKAIYTGLIGYTIFVFTLEGVINIGLPEITHYYNQKAINNQAYSIIFNNIYQTWFSVLACTIIFDIFNIRLLSKWKFLLKGKYFVVRSIGSSSLSIILFTLVTNFFAFNYEILHGNYKFYLEVNIISISAKVITLIVLSYPALLLCKFLKKSENLDITQNINLFLCKRSAIRILLADGV